MWDLNFINEKNFKKHINETILEYGNVLNSIDLNKFNSNLIDPIKLIFDKNVYQKSYEELINDEIARQRDKSNSNIIGYFHQNIFKYIGKCEVLKHGFDVVFDKRVFVELKNKHNTMNSSSSAKTMMRMQNKILENETYQCFLVEVIAKKSQNIPWACSIDNEHIKNERIRRVSIDKFYELITGDSDAFYKICHSLPKVIFEILSEKPELKRQKDTVLDELKAINSSYEKALFSLAFSSYLGFNKDR